MTKLRRNTIRYFLEISFKLSWLFLIERRTTSVILTHPCSNCSINLLSIVITYYPHHHNLGLTGHPTIPVLFDENSWQYISQESRVLFPTHKLTPIKTIHYILYFDQKYYLISIKISYSLSKKIEFDKESTPAQGYSEGALKDVFGNIGWCGLKSE